MAESGPFQLQSARFVMDDGLPQEISFLGPRADPEKTHITLIAGANGTSKSRILACLVDRICEINDGISDQRSAKRVGSGGNHGLVCDQISIRGQTDRNQNQGDKLVQLPSKVLVLSNLVMDRFRFVQSSPSEGQFYQYLGVRQASNLTTTGSMQRSVSEAVMNLYQDNPKHQLFQKWLELVFGGSREVALVFDRVSRFELEKYVSDPEREERIVERVIRRRGRARVNDPKYLQSIREAVPNLIHLFEFLLGRAEDIEFTSERKTGRRSLVLRLDALPKRALKELAEFSSVFTEAVRFGLFSWPTVSIEGNAESGWTDFGQLSSGEQNILSTGAKLVSHAEPGCLIAIDEPEVSLNTSWQQHYTDLVAQSLSEAPGSHVLIATHSPHLIASLPSGEASVILIEKQSEGLKTSTVDAEFEGWGAEAVLYQVLDIPSASSFKFQRELASILLHIQGDGQSKKLLDDFLEKSDRLNFEGLDALKEVVESIRQYREKLG